MESSQWVIAISTALIAGILLLFAVVWIRAGIALRRDLKLLSDNAEKKIQALDKTCWEILSFDSIESRESKDRRPPILPKVLRSVIFGIALWNNFQKRR